jgi:NADH-quinone oxidoreductase subunit K
LFCFLFFVFFQALFLQEVLLFFVSFDLVFTFVSVIFILLGLLFGQADGIVFFFVILAVVACETALGLGFLVSFSRRHGTVTMSSLRYLLH